MTTAAAPPQPAAGLVPLFAGVPRSEARKLGTVRSTFWILLAAIGFTVVTAALPGLLLPGHPGPHQKATIDSVRVSLGGLHLSQIAVGLLGVLAVTSEYSSGIIRATLAAVPPRRLLLTAKTLVLPESWQATLGPCLPMNAGDAIYTIRPEAHTLQPWTGFGVFCLYPAAALAAGFILIGRRGA